MHIYVQENSLRNRIEMDNVNHTYQYQCTSIAFRSVTHVCQEQRGQYEQYLRINNG